MSTFYIVRHGQSIANSQKIMQGAMIDTPLTTTSQAQDYKTAAKLSQHNFLMKIIIYYPAHKNILTVKHTHKQRRDSSVSLTKRPKSCRKTHKFYWSVTVTPSN